MNCKLLVAALLAGTAWTTAALAGDVPLRAGESIQNAISRARTGDTVLVPPGTYAPFNIDRNGITVRSTVPGGAHVVATGRGQPAVGAYGQNNIALIGFRLTSRQGDGIKFGGRPGAMASNIRVENNIVESARLDGLKVFQARNVSMVGNTIRASGTGGIAGSGGNRNGDGGIDWVQVVDSEMSGNTVSSQGWACAMIKGGSGNNEIVDNDFANCAVNGIDMAAPTTGAAGAANRSGLTAFDNTVEGNRIDGGTGCAIALGSATRNIRLTDNQVAGQNCGGGSGDGSSGSGATGSVGADVSGVGGITAGGADGQGGYEVPSIESRLLEHTAIASSSDCGKASGTLGTAGSIVSGILGGGRATLPAQIAQQGQLIFQSVCATRQLEAQLKMLQGLGLNTVAEVEGAMSLIQGVLGASQQVVYELARADSDWNRVFIETNGVREMPPELAYPAMGERYGQMREYADAAMHEAARIRAQAVTNMKSGNGRSQRIADASAAAVGPTQAVQAGNLLVLETHQELQAMHGTVLSYNEAQSRIAQEGRIQSALSNIFFEKNFESMNPDATPVQGAVMFNGSSQREVSGISRSSGAAAPNTMPAGSLSN